MKRILFLSVVVLGGLVFTLNSCKKEKPDTETQSSVDNSFCEGEFTRTMNTVNGFGIREQGVKSLMDYGRSSCPTIVIDPADTLNGFPVTMTIDYGTTGCYDSIDHKTRKGTITCVFSNYWHLVGSYIKVNLANYSVDGVSYTTDSIKFIHGAPASFTTQVYNGVVTNSSWTMKWACNRTITQTGGNATPLNFYDDVYSLTGSANGVNRNGLAYTSVITTSIVKRTSCSWIESGRIDLTPDGYATRTVDFGSGNCDNQATLTINGNTFTFTMN